MRHPEERGEGRVTSSQALVLGSLNVRGCSTIESKRCEIGSMFVKRKMDVLALSETKMKGKGEAEFREVKGRISGIERGRAREGVALLLSERMRSSVVEWKECSSRMMWVKVRIGRECWTFVSAYGPGSEKSDEEREEFWNGLNDCIESLSRSSYVVVLGDLKFFGACFRYALSFGSGMSSIGHPLNHWGSHFGMELVCFCGGCVLLFINFGTWWLAAERRCRRESALSFLLFYKLHARFPRTLLP